MLAFMPIVGKASFSAGTILCSGLIAFTGQIPYAPKRENP
jgi:hypothetical protein